MPEPQDFINQSKTVGKSDQAIFSELKVAGWTDEQLQPFFPNLIAGSQPMVASSQEATVKGAHKAKKRWLLLIGLFAAMLVLAAAAFAAVQYFGLDQFLKSEPASPVPDSEIATQSAQLQPTGLVASSSAKVVYSMTDPQTKDIKINVYDFAAEQSKALYTISASDSATLTAGFWSPSGRYLPITINADQPQVLIYDSQSDQMNRYQSEFANPWEIVPGFLAHWSSSSTVIINEEAIRASDQVKSFEMSPSGDVIAAEVDPRIKFGTDNYTVDYGLASAKTADIVLTSQQVPVVLREQATTAELGSLVPVGLKEEAMWFISIEAAEESSAAAQLDPSLDPMLVSGASAINTTPSTVLGVTTLTGLETHFYGYSAIDGQLIDEQVISSPGWMTSKMLVNPVTQDFYILEYQQLDDSGNGLVQLRKLSFSNFEQENHSLLEFTTNVTRLIPEELGVATYDFTEDGQWFVFEKTDLATSQNQIAAQQLSSEITSDPIVICDDNCGWYRVYNPETLVPR